MRIDRLRIENYCQHESRDIRFGPGLTGIFGHNGCGKSNLIDALRFAVTGESANIGNKTDNLRHGAKAGRVILDFTAGDTAYTLTRAVHSSTCSLVAHTEDAEGRETKINGTNKVEPELTKLLGASPKVLQDTVFVPQGAIDSVLFDKPADRYKTFQSLFGLGGALDAWKMLGEHSRSVDTTPGLEENYREALALAASSKDLLATYDRQAQQLQGEAAELEGCKDVIQRAEAAERHKTVLSQAQNSYEQKLKAKDEQAAVVFDHQQELDALTQVFNIERAQADFDAKTQLRQRLQAQHQEWMRLKEARDRVEELERQIAQLPAIDGERVAEARQQMTSLAEEEQKLRGMLSGQRQQFDSEKQAAQKIEEFQRQLAALGTFRVSNDITAEVLRLQHEAQHVELMASGTCPTCGQEVDGGPEGVAARRQRMEVDQAACAARTKQEEEAHKAQANQLQTNLAAAQAELQQAQESVRQFLQEKLDRTIDHLVAARSVVVPADEISLQYTNLTTERDTRRQMLGQTDTEEPSLEDIQRLVAEEQELHQRIVEYGQKQAQVRDAQRQLESADQAMHDASAHLQSLAGELDAPGPDEVQAALEQRKQLTALEAQLTDVQVQAATERGLLEGREQTIRRLAEQLDSEKRDQAWKKVLDTTRDALHPTAAPGMLMRGYAQVVNQQMDAYLNQWGAPFRVWLTDDMAFRAQLNGQPEIDAARLSGGQRIVASVSFRLAMADVFAQQSGLLVLDEPTSYLDQSNIQQLHELLIHLRGMGGRQMLVITHEQSIMGFFDHTYTVDQQEAVA